MVFFENCSLFSSSIFAEYLKIVYKTTFELQWCSLWLNHAFSNKLETFQYNAALAITGAIKCTSRKKLYQQLVLEYLQQRRRMKCLCLIYKVVSTKLPAYIYDISPPVRQSQRHPPI